MNYAKSVTGRLVRDSSGVVDSVGMVVMVTILAVGLIVGLTAIQKSMVQEFGDVGVALERISQSYSARIGTVVSRYDDTVVVTDTNGSPPDNVCIKTASGEN